MTPRIIKIVYVTWHLQGLSRPQCFQNCHNCPCPPVTSINGITSGALESKRSTDSSPGIIAGAALGGALFGFITSLIIFVMFCRKSSSSNSSKRNPAYEHEYNTKPNTSKDYFQASTAYAEINDEMQKTARIAPIKEYEEPAIRDGVYNHLNESDKADKSDYYDHAGPAPSMSVTKDGYGVVSMKSESNGDYHTADRQNNGNEQNDTYFTFQED
ncbi:uncharacterized protein LOC111109800 isoform X2 [Crassostrea virginica]